LLSLFLHFLLNLLDFFEQDLWLSFDLSPPVFLESQQANLLLGIPKRESVLLSKLGSFKPVRKAAHEYPLFTGLRPYAPEPGRKYMLASAGKHPPRLCFI
jgi:hypothetical protein